MPGVGLSCTFKRKSKQAVFSHKHKKKPRGEKRKRDWGKKVGMLCEAWIWWGFDFKGQTKKPQINTQCPFSNKSAGAHDDK